MKSYLADNKQLFNVKEIAFATELADLEEGQTGFFPVDSDTSVAASTALPEEFRIISLLNGEIYYSFDTIKKTRMRDLVKTEFTEGQVNSWKGVIDYCGCITSAELKVNISDDQLIRMDGLTWTHADSTVAVPSEDLSCLDCDDSELRFNVVMTKLLYKAVKAKNSDFYDVKVFVVDGAELEDLEAIEDHIEALDEDTGAMLEIHVIGKERTAGYHADIDQQFDLLRGVRLTPAIILNQEIGIAFEEVDEVIFEKGAGYDFRQAEWDNMGYYTNLNNYTQLSNGLPNPAIRYQFENGKNYDSISFDFHADTTESNDGETRLFGVIIGAETGDAVVGQLDTLFGL